MTSIKPALVSELFHHLYESVESTESWPAFMDLLVKSSESDGGALIHHNLQSGRPAGYYSGYDDGELRRFVNYYASINPWLPKPQPARGLPQGNVVSGESVLPLAKLKQTEFYADWGRRNDVVFTIAANLNLNNKAFFYMALSNGERRGSHSAAIAELMALLIPHVRRATHLQMRLLEVGALGSALDALTIPVMFLDSGCRVLEMSRLAEEVLRRRDGLELRRGAVELPANPANASLQREVHEFFKEDGPSGRMFRIPRPSNGEFIAVLLKPGQRQFALSPGKVILMLIDPNGQSKDGLTLASALYRLTPAEGAFVRILVETGSLDATIEIRRISRNTARTQMASIFRKTGTNRQGQLIKLFSTVGRITQMGDDAAEGIALQ